MTSDPYFTARLDFTRRAQDDPNVDIAWLKGTILSQFERPSLSSSVTSMNDSLPSRETRLSLVLRNNNLRSDNAAETLANTLLSLLIRRRASIRHEWNTTDANSSQNTSTSLTTGVLPCIVELDLTCTGATSDTAPWIRLFEAMNAGRLPDRFLERIILDDEVLSPRQCAPLVRLLFQCSSLTHISLRRCLLTSINMETVSQAIVTSSMGLSLTSLDLSENDITSSGLLALCSAMATSPSYLDNLKVLRLDENQVALSREDSVCPHLLQYNRKGLLALAEFVLKASHLCLVSLSSNRLGDRYANCPLGVDHGGVTELCEAARRSLTTKTCISVSGRDKQPPPIIDLSRNGFDDKTGQSLHRCSGFTCQL